MNDSLTRDKILLLLFLLTLPYFSSPTIITRQRILAKSKINNSNQSVVESSKNSPFKLNNSNVLSQNMINKSISSDKEQLSNNSVKIIKNFVNTGEIRKEFDQSAKVITLPKNGGGLAQSFSQDLDPNKIQEIKSPLNKSISQVKDSLNRSTKSKVTQQTIPIQLGSSLKHEIKLDESNPSSVVLNKNIVSNLSSLHSNVNSMKIKDHDEDMNSLKSVDHTIKNLKNDDHSLEGVNQEDYIRVDKSARVVSEPLVDRNDSLMVKDQMKSLKTYVREESPKLSDQSLNEQEVKIVKKTFAEELDEEQIILPNINNKYESANEVESDLDVDEDTHFGQSLLLKDGSLSAAYSEEFNNWTPNLIIANIIYIFLVISGIYCCFLGFRFFKLTMILLGLDFSYYFIIMFLTEFDIYDGSNVGHQLGVFFGSLLLGFLISIISYLFEKCQFFIIGFSIGSMISVFLAQFFIDFEDNHDKIVILCVYLGASVVFTIAAYASQHSTLIWGTVIVGSILATINCGVLLNDFKSFEQREKLPNDRYSDFVNYLIANAILICLGLLVQFYLKKKIIQRLKRQDEELDSDMYTIRATTFL